MRRSNSPGAAPAGEEIKSVMPVVHFESILTKAKTAEAVALRFTWRSKTVPNSRQVNLVVPEIKTESAHFLPLCEWGGTAASQFMLTHAPGRVKKKVSCRLQSLRHATIYSFNLAAADQSFLSMGS
jgi:hypothetical protein